MTSEDNVRFLYSAAPLQLSERDIRLVELLCDKASDKPTCVLRVYPVEGPHPPYIALSYAWGHDVCYADITLNGCPFSVGRSLWHFLDQMRSSKRYATYWIDALSIDQGNVQERNCQVQMMRQIYSNAVSVVVWLGEEDMTANSNVAIDYLREREQLQPGNANVGRFWTARQAKAVLALCKRPYWTRVWIVQELLLGKDIMICCGTKRMHWAHLKSFFDDVASVVVAWGQHLRVGPILESAAASIVKAKSNWNGQRSQPLRQLLMICRNQQSTDIRDKIYALHGLANDTDDMDVDYGITARQLLVTAVKHTCVSFRRNQNNRESRKQVLQTCQMLRDILRVPYNDHELEIIVDSEERRMSVDDDLGKAEKAHMRSENQRTNARHHVMIKARKERPWSTHSVKQKCCYFAFLHCPFRTFDPSEWQAHCIEHFLLEELPKIIRCMFCDSQESLNTSRTGAPWVTEAIHSGIWTCEVAMLRNQSASGWTLWDAHVEHIQKDHQGLCVIRDCAIQYEFCQQLFTSGLLNEGELGLLLLKGHLQEIPAKYMSAARDDGSKEEELLTGIQHKLRMREREIARRLVAIYDARDARDPPVEVG